MDQWFNGYKSSIGERTTRQTMSARSGSAVPMVLAVLGLMIVSAGIWIWAGGSSSGSLSDWHHDIPTGLEISEATGKPILVLFTADWCPPCRQLKKQVLTDRSVSRYLHDQFVLVKIDLTERGGPNQSVASEFGVQGIPTMFVFDQNANMIDSVVGGIPKSQFESWIKNCRQQVSG